MQKIPKIVFQTSKKTLDDYVIERLKSKFKDYTYNHFTDEQILLFFDENPIVEFKDIKEKFIAIKSGPHKADLFRYYFLYVNGGVYVDSDLLIEEELQDLITHDFISVKAYFNEKNLLFNGFVACTKQHEIIYHALKHIYNLTNEDFKKDYFVVCKELYKIHENLKHKSKTIIYQEVKYKKFLEGVRTYDNKGLNVMSHYCYTKRIPKLTEKWAIKAREEEKYLDKLLVPITEKKVLMRFS